MCPEELGRRERESWGVPVRMVFLFLKIPTKFCILDDFHQGFEPHNGGSSSSSVASVRDGFLHKPFPVVGGGGAPAGADGGDQGPHHRGGSAGGGPAAPRAGPRPRRQTPPHRVNQRWWWWQEEEEEEEEGWRHSHARSPGGSSSRTMTTASEGTRRGRFGGPRREGERRGGEAPGGAHAASLRLRACQVEGRRPRKIHP